jgi:hypothetical protein
MVKLDTFPKVMATLLIILAAVIGLVVWGTPQCELIENTCEGSFVQEELVPDSRKLPPPVPEDKEPLPSTLDAEPLTPLSAFQVHQDSAILVKARNWIYMEYKEQNILSEYQGLSIQDAVKRYPDKFKGYKNSFPNGYLVNSMVKSAQLSEAECDTYNYAILADAQVPSGDEIYYVIQDDPAKLRSSPLPGFCFNDGHVYYKLD